MEKISGTKEILMQALQSFYAKTGSQLSNIKIKKDGTWEAHVETPTLKSIIEILSQHKNRPDFKSGATKRIEGVVQRYIQDFLVEQKRPEEPNYAGVMKRTEEIMQKPGGAEILRAIPKEDFLNTYFGGEKLWNYLQTILSELE